MNENKAYGIVLLVIIAVLVGVGIYRNDIGFYIPAMFIGLPLPISWILGKNHGYFLIVCGIALFPVFLVITIGLWMVKRAFGVGRESHKQKVIREEHWFFW